MGLPCGTYNETYEQDMTIVRTRFQWGILIAGLVLLFTMPLWFESERWLQLANLIGISIIAAQGLNLLTGCCGQISLGHAAFMMVGAYSSAWFTMLLGWSFWAALPAAGLCAGVVGGIFGIPAIRLKGFYLLIATLAAHFIIIWILTNWPALTGGIHGITVPAPELAGIVFDSTKAMYFPVMIIAVAMVFFAKNIGRSRIGRAFVAVRDSDLAANVMGINVSYYKFLAFFVSSFYAGIAGALYAAFMTGVNVEFFSLNMSIWFVAMLIVGGMDSVFGAIVGTIFIQVFEEMASETLVPYIVDLFPLIGNTVQAGLPLIVFALVLIVFLIFEPRGINHRWSLFKNYYRLYPFPY